MEYITVKKLQKQYGLPWRVAERIISEQTRETYFRHWLPASCWLAALLLPALLQFAHRWERVVVHVACLVLIVAGIVSVRFLKHGTIVASAREQAAKPVPDAEQSEV